MIRSTLSTAISFSKRLRATSGLDWSSSSRYSTGRPKKPSRPLISSTMISAAILWMIAVWARKPVSDSVPPTRTDLPDGAARRIAGDASAAPAPTRPVNTRRRRHAPIPWFIVPSTAARSYSRVISRNVGPWRHWCKRFFENFETFEDAQATWPLGHSRSGDVRHLPGVSSGDEGEDPSLHRPHESPE